MNPESEDTWIPIYCVTLDVCLSFSELSLSICVIQHRTLEL
jgi:hypothetical protein